MSTYFVGFLFLFMYHKEGSSRMKQRCQSSHRLERGSRCTGTWWEFDVAVEQITLAIRRNLVDDNVTTANDAWAAYT